MLIKDKILDSYYILIIFLFIDTRACDFKTDNNSPILEEHVSILNDAFNGIVKINIKNLSVNFNINSERLIELYNNDIKLLYILSFHRIDDDIMYYIHDNIEGALKYKFKLFFLVVLEKIPKSYFLHRYISSFSNDFIKNIFSFYYHAFKWDGAKDVLTSIHYLDKLIASYPNFISFYMFKIRQTFEYFYRIKIGKSKFNKLLTSTKGIEFIKNSTEIKKCISLFEKASKISKKNYVYYLFKGKFLLHILDDRGIGLLNKSLELKKNVFNNDIFSWIGVYYLQIGDYKKAEPYINFAKYYGEDNYKYFSKLLYMYRISGDKDMFCSKLCSIFDLEVYIYLEKKYYLFLNGVLSFVERPNDINDITKYTRFSFSNMSIDLPNKVQKKELYSFLFDYMSKDYFAHWSFQDCPKFIFYSKKFY